VRHDVPRLAGLEHATAAAVVVRRMEGPRNDMQGLRRGSLATRGAQAV